MKAANSIYVNRNFNCSVHTLFKWMSRAELIKEWFGPNHLKVENVESNLKVGGKYSIQFLKPDGSYFFINGKYMEIVEPTKLVFSFSYIGLPHSPPDSIVQILLEEIAPDASKLSLVQKFDSYPTDFENREKAWKHMLSKLKEKITTNNSKI